RDAPHRERSAGARGSARAGDAVAITSSRAAAERSRHPAASDQLRSDASSARSQPAHRLGDSAVAARAVAERLYCRATLTSSAVFLIELGDCLGEVTFEVAAPIASPMTQQSADQRQRNERPTAPAILGQDRLTHCLLGQVLARGSVEHLYRLLGGE